MAQITLTSVNKPRMILDLGNGKAYGSDVINAAHDAGVDSSTFQLNGRALKASDEVPDGASVTAFPNLKGGN